MRGFYVGRFQPFHLGHYKVLEEVAEDVPEIVIAIGTAQASHTVKNPFTAGERVSMVRKSVNDLDATTYVIPIEDINRNSLWVSHIESMAPEFDVIYSNNPLVIRLFEEDGKEVRKNPLFDRSRYSGREIRKRMIEGGDWRDLVPDPVEDVIDEVDGVDRIKQVNQTDYPD
ncbi:nicotinamide-nucleotide adenylyltransferase [Halorutilales archaeon Cl-col2-1]